MAEESQKPEANEETAVVTTAEVAESVAETKATKLDDPLVVTEDVKVEAKEALEEKVIAQSISFKEETNLASELPEAEKKALDELKQLIKEALSKHEFKFLPPVKEEEKPAEEKVSEEVNVIETVQVVTEELKVESEAVPEAVNSAELDKPSVPSEDPPKTVEVIDEAVVAAVSSEEVVAAEPAVEPEEVFIWGIPLVGEEKCDVVLLKFLRARDFKVKEAFAMIKNTVKWRKEFGIDALLEEDLGNELEKHVFMSGFGKDGHPVCYNVYGVFQDKDLYQSCFADEEKRVKFLRWRIQFLEKSIRKLDFNPCGVSTFVQVNDLKNSPGPTKRELRQTTNQAVHLLQDNYPEFVAKQVFINVSWWYLAFQRMMSLTQRTKSKFVYAGPSKSAETLFKYIAPEQVPVQYGGLNREGERDFCVSDPATEATIKPSSKHTIEFSVTENCTLVWELRVIGWEVSYGAQFIPSHEEGYTVIVSKTRKVSPADEPILSDAYKMGEPGKIVLTLDNQTSKKKKLLYRFKSKPLD